MTYKLFMSNWIPIGSICPVDAYIWLLRNVGRENHGWYTTTSMYATGWMIEKSEDAVAFKLRFGI